MYEFNPGHMVKHNKYKDSVIGKIICVVPSQSVALVVWPNGSKRRAWTAYQYLIIVQVSTLDAVISCE